MPHSSRSSPSFFARLSAALRSGQLLEEKNRLEAFLASVPGAYCGFDRDGGIAWNETFAETLGVEKIGRPADIAAAFEPEDAAILEGQINSLRDSGISFHKVLTLKGGQKWFRLSGRRGNTLDEDDFFDVLWLEDVTRDVLEREKLKTRHERTRRELKATQDACDATPFPVWLRREDMSLSWCNKSYAQAVGTTPAEVIARQIELEPMTPEKGDIKAKTRFSPKDMAQQTQEDGKLQSRSGHMVASGKRRLYLFQELPIDRRSGTMGMALDLTREEELKDELSRYVTAQNDLLEQLRTAIAVFNAEQQLEFYNSAFSQLWQVEEQYLNTNPKLGDLMEKLREQRSLPEQADFRSFKKSWINMFTSLLKPYEEMLYLPNESVLRMLVTPHPHGGLMMTFEDVTSRLQLESSYNTLIAVQRETLDNLGEGVTVFGSDGRLRLWNPSFGEIWQITPEALEGEPHITQLVDKMKPCFTPEFWPQYFDQLIALGLTREEQAGRLSLVDDRHIDYTTLPLADGGVLVTFTDMTDTVQVENALREKNIALEAAERLKLDFLANVSYQLRTPLNSIMGFTEMLSGEYIGELNEQQKDYTTNITEASERLLSLINDILDLSTIEAGFLELEQEPVKVHDLLQGLSRLVRDWARQKKIDIILDCPKNIGALTADERRLKQVLLNLLRNAIAFTSDDGSGIIRLSAEKDGPRIAISVKDNGVGIPSEDQERIFEPFERGLYLNEADSSSARGAGLGLSIVRNIIELHGGSVELSSVPHEGTEVTLYLPV